MCNLYTKFVRFLEICKDFSKDLVKSPEMFAVQALCLVSLIWKSSH